MQLPVLCAAYNAARGELYSAGQDPVIRVWEAVGGALLRRQPGHRGYAPDEDIVNNAPTWNKRVSAQVHMRDWLWKLCKDGAGVLGGVGAVPLRETPRPLRWKAAGWSQQASVSSLVN